MKLIVLLITVVGLVAADLDPLSDEFIEEINRVATTWTAGRNFHKDTPMTYLKGLMGVAKGKAKSTLPTLKSEGYNPVNLPKAFDARTKWPNCPSISEIRDQSSCKSAWAISAVEIMTDRQCIHKNEHFHYSTEDLISCCTSCGKGCEDGNPVEAMIYWRDTGIVSGGQFNSSEGCQPYTFPKCEHHVAGPLPNCTTVHPKTPACSNKCRKGYAKTFEADKKKAYLVYEIDQDETIIMQEIMNNGPIQVFLWVYTDFLSYKSGIYQQTKGARELGVHAVRCLGWGEENHVKYWIIANSWNIGWGDKGYFKILKGVNECNIEQDALAGMPE